MKKILHNRAILDSYLLSSYEYSVLQFNFNLNKEADIKSYIG